MTTTMPSHLHVQWGCGLRQEVRHAEGIRNAWEEALESLVSLVAVEIVHCTNGDIINMMVSDEAAAMVMWCGLAAVLNNPKVVPPTGYDLSPVVSIGRPPEWCHAPHPTGDTERTVDRPLPTEANAPISQRPITTN